MMKKIIILLTACSLALVVNTTFAVEPRLKVSKATLVNYQCDNNTKMSVRYYNISDNSLGFVKFKLKGENYTLPNVVSGSGARYTDLHQVEWHEKNDTATMNEDINDSQSKQINCKKSN